MSILIATINLVKEMGVCQMPVPMYQRIDCKKCGSTIKTARFHDVLTPEDIRKRYFSYCGKCKVSFLKKGLKTVLSKNQ